MPSDYRNGVHQLHMWLNSTQTRFFLIPAEQTLPAGDLVLRTLTGQAQSVDPAAAAQFEVTEEQAKQYVQARLGEALEQIPPAVSDYLGMLAHQAEKQEFAWSFKPGAPSPLVTDLLGFTPEQLRQNPELAKQWLGNLVDGLGTFLNQAASSDPAEQAAAQQRIRSLQATLERHGVATDAEKLEQIPAKLRAGAMDEERKKRKEQLAASLQELAGAITKAAGEMGQALQKQADELHGKAEQAAPPETD